MQHPPTLALFLPTVVLASVSNEPRLGFFLKSASIPSNLSIPSSAARVLEGTAHFRVIPGFFPQGMGFHFDGLATVLKLEFFDGSMELSLKKFESEAGMSYEKCNFFGTGTGPTSARTNICFQNPGVNILPIQSQLWLTTDTNAWGRINPASLDAIPAKVKTINQILNAHPACDHVSKECFVQHPCTAQPMGSSVCFSELKTSPNGIDLEIDTFASGRMNASAILQHSHSPCVTPNYVVSKLDRFELRNPFNQNSGLLRFVSQGMSNSWFIASRPGSNHHASRVTYSKEAFVNNHFMNCFENDQGKVVVDLIATTDLYLDTYFLHSLKKPAPWTQIFAPPLRCIVDPFEGDVECEELLPQDPNLYLDYPTFNPLWKMRPDSEFVYAIAAEGSSQWFDRIIKIDSKTQRIVDDYQAEGTYFTEPSFIPGSKAKYEEDDGYLLSISFSKITNSSFVTILHASSFEILEELPLPGLIPFHAHGVSCIHELGMCV
uniref:Carotenoid oxygenase n=1 Tax=Amorphochlora amoebiformis TaxID=1561963 RepID=A0A7S0GXQ8_9EUKA|mmetsp:Transcript_25104/g.39686  ORF Transcript_25104/g.39686 Transcript_25104/m.39686 type:complete len:491 (+) Transcript_25104:51-1523(+)